MTLDGGNSPSGRTRLLELLAPILARIAALDPRGRVSAAQIAELEQTLEREFPHDGEHVRTLGAAIAQGVSEGWLCDRGEPHARFSRLAKPTPATHGLSIDVVDLSGSGIEHSHPTGEVTIGFAVEGAPRFDGKNPGWVFLAPGSRHVPTVTDGRMQLLYCMPDGAVEWHLESR